MKQKFIELQLFADDPAVGTEPIPGTESKPAAPANDTNPAAQPKYTDEDVDKLINQKFAEWQKKQEKKTSEAERLGRMTAEEQANERMKALEDKLHEYETSAARAEMTKQARAILLGENIHVGDELVTQLIAEDAESTKASVDSFVKLFKGAVESAVKEALKSETPKTGGSSGMTREQIMTVANRAERQRLIKENMDLFK